MIKSTLLLIAVLLTLASVPGCHYYIDATPHIILSSEPIPPPEPRP